MTAVPTKDIIVIGSAGSSGPLKRLLGDLPANLPASVFISTHIPAHSPSFLSEVLSAGAVLPVTQAVDGSRSSGVTSMWPRPIDISCWSKG